MSLMAAALATDGGTVKILLAVVLIVVIAFALGACRVEFSVTNPLDAVSDRADKAMEGNDPASIATRRALGKRSKAERAWAARVNRECARRAKRMAAVRPPAGGLKDLGRYAAEVQRVQQRHVQALQTYPAPASYAQEAAFMRAAEQQRLTALERVVDAAANKNGDAAKSAIKMFETVGSSSKTVFRSIGLNACA